MKRPGAFIAVSVLLALGVCNTIGCFLNPRQQLLEQNTPKRQTSQSEDISRHPPLFQLQEFMETSDFPGEPPHHPELFGKIEAVSHLGSQKTFLEILVRSTKPNLANWDSDTNAEHRSLDMPCYVRLVGTPVYGRGGEVPELAVGQTVSVWCSGPMQASYPPHWSADFLIVEPADR